VRREPAFRSSGSRTMAASRRCPAAKRVATPSASGCEPKCLPLDERQANLAAFPAEMALRIGTNSLNMARKSKSMAANSKTAACPAPYTEPRGSCLAFCIGRFGRRRAARCWWRRLRSGTRRISGPGPSHQVMCRPGRSRSRGKPDWSDAQPRLAAQKAAELNRGEFQRDKGSMCGIVRIFGPRAGRRTSSHALI
jgi:hypothetical protein